MKHATRECIDLGLTTLQLFGYQYRQCEKEKKSFLTLSVRTALILFFVFFARCIFIFSVSR